MGVLSSRYSHIILYDGDELVWSLDDDFDLEFAAGASFALEFSLFLLKEGGTTKNYHFELIDANNKKVPFPKVMDHFGKEICKFEEVRHNGINRVCSLLKPRYNNMVSTGNSVWMVNYKTPTFIQGILTILNAFKVDYRRMMIACSIHLSIYDGKYIIKYYQIQGYPLPYFPLENNGNFISPETPVPPICDKYFNPPDKIIPNMDQRLKSVREYLTGKYAASRLSPDKVDEIVDNIMSEAPDVLIHTDPEKDIRTIEYYIEFRRDNMGRGDSKRMAEAFLAATY